MKAKTFFLLLFASCAISAQSNVDLDVIYENANTVVETGQQGAVSITVTNPNPVSISVRLSKSFNIYSENSMGAHVSIYNPNEAQITDTCQWHYASYSPWPPWTDGETMSIIIDDVPASSSVTCEAEYLIGMVDGEANTVGWDLRLLSSSDLLDSQSNTFRVGPMPQAVSVPSTQWWSNLLLGVLILMLSFYLLPQLKFSFNKK